jgi:hypothetical protein
VNPSTVGPVTSAVVERSVESRLSALSASDQRIVTTLMSRYRISEAAARKTLGDPQALADLLGGVDDLPVTSSSIRAEVEAQYQREAQLLDADREKLERDRQARLARAAELEEIERQQAAETARREEEALEQAKASTITVRAEDRDRKVESLTRYLAGERGGYRSLLAAWMDITRESERPTPEEWKRSFRTYVDGQRAPDYSSLMNRQHESINSATFGEVFGDSVTRRMLAEYATLPGLQAWRALVSSIRTSITYRTQRGTRMGSYGQLPVVAQGAPFQALPTAGDEEATYSPIKRGGLEDLTFEAFLNGDGGEFLAVPAKLARAAGNTINRQVLDKIQTNPTIYDGVALFAAGHNNTATAALSSANLYARRAAMRQQTALSDTTDVLGAIPRFLLVPPALEEVGHQIVAAQPALVNGDETSVGLREPLDLIVVNHWSSSATQWYLVANPRSVPTLEVGFVADTPDPELIIAPDPNTDKVTVKIRHAYEVVVVDYRGFQRGNV